MDGGDAGKGWFDSDYVANVKRAISEWRAEQPSIVSYILGTAAAPIAWLLRYLVPQAAIEGILSGLDWCAKNILTNQSASNPDNLAECDQNADNVVNLHIGGAIVEGGAAGFFGAISLPADIPAVILLALRTIRQVGVEYGFTDDTEDERRFVLSILSASGANSQAEKAEALAVASFLMNVLAKQTWKAMAANAAIRPISTEAAIIAVRNLAKQLGINLTKRKALAAVPMIGAVIGAGANGWFIREVGVAAQRLYQERWLRDRNLLIDEE